MPVLDGHLAGCMSVTVTGPCNVDLQQEQTGGNQSWEGMIQGEHICGDQDTKCLDGNERTGKQLAKCVLGDLKSLRGGVMDERGAPDSSS